MARNTFLKLILVTVLISVVSCGDFEMEDQLRPIELQLVESYFLSLDSVTTSNNEFYQVLEADSGTYLTFFNPLVYAIYTYDLDKRELVNSISFEKDGPNGLGEKVMSYHILSKDSILIHSYYDRCLYLANGFGQVIGKYPLYTNAMDSYPKTGDGAGIQKLGNQLLFNSGIGCSTENPEKFRAQTALNLKDSSITELLPFPKAYQTKKNSFWPGIYCNLFSVSIGCQKGLAYSFAGDEKIYFYDSSGTITSSVFGKGKLRNQRPIPFRQFPRDAMSEFITFLSYNRFGRIHYDPYRELIIRSFHYSTPDELIEENVFKTKSTLLIANSDMEVLGEAQLSGDHELFFTPKGLHQVLFNSNREDSLEIRLYDYNF